MFQDTNPIFELRGLFGVPVQIGGSLFLLLSFYICTGGGDLVWTTQHFAVTVTAGIGLVLSILWVPGPLLACALDWRLLFFTVDPPAPRHDARPSGMGRPRKFARIFCAGLCT